MLFAPRDNLAINTAAVFCLLICINQSVQSQQIEQFRNGLVRIEVKKGPSRASNYGTGFVISTQGDTISVLTARHLFYPDSKGEEVDFTDFTPDSWVSFYIDKLHPRRARWVKDSVNLDLAVLEVSATGLQASQLPKFLVRSENNALVSGEDVYICGSGANSWPIAKNSISEPSYGDRLDLFLYTGTGLGGGFSGAPVLDADGRLVGVHLGAAEGDERYGRAVRMTDAVKVLRELGISAMNNLNSAGAASSHVPVTNVGSDTNKQVDCSFATAEALRLSLQSHMLDRVAENVRCRPENRSDAEAGQIVAHMFERESFSKSREFLAACGKPHCRVLRLSVWLHTERSTPEILMPWLGYSPELAMLAYKVATVLTMN